LLKEAQDQSKQVVLPGRDRLLAGVLEQLTDEWQEVGLERYRIWDREAYDVQMRKLLGIL
jgi:hypothetical protein